MKKKSNRVPIHIVIMYAAIGVGWIVLSDRFLVLFTNDIHTLGVWQTYKGLAFVLGTALLLYALLFKETILFKRYHTVLEESDDVLRKSEERYRSLFENMLNGFAYCRMVFDDDRPIDFIYLDVNKAFESLTGLKNVIGKKVTEVIPGIRESDNDLLTIYGRVALTGKPETFEMFIESLNDWYFISVYSPQKEYFVAVFDVITKRKRAEEALTSERNLLKALMDTTTDHIYFKDNNSRFIRMSKAHADVFGISDPAQALGKTDFDFFTEEHARPTFETESEIMKTGKPVVGLEEKETWPDGRVTWVSTTKLPLRNPDGKIIGTFGISRDITEHKKAELEILKLNRTYAVLSNINQLIVRERNRQRIFEETCKIAVEYGSLSMCWIGIIDDATGAVNPVARAGITDGYLEQAQVVLSADTPEGRGPTGSALRKGRAIIYNDIENDKRMLPWREKALALGFKSSAAFPLRIRSRIIGTINFYSSEANYFNDQEIALFDELAMDISYALESLEVEEMHKKAEQKNAEQARLLDIALDVIIVRDMNDRLLFWNKAAENLYGWTFEEANLFDVRGLISDNDLPAYEKSRSEFYRNGVWEGELHQKTKDGRDLITFSRWTLVRDQQGKPSARLIVTRDITEHKKAEEALRQSHAFNEMMLQTIPFGMDIVDEQGTILFMSKTMRDLIGTACAGQTCWSVYKDNKEQCVDCPLRSGIEIGKSDILESADALGGRIFQINHIGIMYRGKKAMLEVFVDVTEQRKLQNQLLQAQKIQSIGTLAGGIAHDFNNILGIILAYSSLLERGIDDKKIIGESSAAITKAVERGASLVRQILTFARRADVSFEPFNISEFIHEMVSMLEETFPKVIEMRSIIEKNIPCIVADHTQMHQALLNLCVNARDAMPNGGTLMIKAETVEQKIVKKRFPAAGNTLYVCIAVSDTGTGIDRKTKHLIFDPFFTTKEKGKGTGLGLSVVYGVMQTHHGFVDVESEEGKGTTFFLYLPLSNESLEKGRSDKTESSEAVGGTECILLVEDEEILRNVLQEFLESKGYRIYAASDGLEAVTFYKEHKNEIDLVMTDIGLPKMTGIEEFKKLREINPQVKVLLAGGFLEPEKKAGLLGDGAKGFIQKPYIPHAVLKELRKIFDAST